MQCSTPSPTRTIQTTASIKEWLDDYDPNVIDQLPIKYALSRIANRRNAAKARLARNRNNKTDSVIRRET